MERGKRRVDKQKSERREERNMDTWRRRLTVKDV